jgi:hypothetical protein
MSLGLILILIRDPINLRPKCVLYVYFRFFFNSETVIDEDNVSFQKNQKTWALFRKISQILAITPLFR